MSETRYSRQTRLVEVGDEGQARIAAARAVVPGDGVAARVEARYLAGAGVSSIACASEAVEGAARAVDARVRVTLSFPTHDEPAPDLGIVDPSARAVAEGAWRALGVLREALYRA